MSETLPEILWMQFGAALQMLENTIRACPLEVWNSENQEPQYWYIAYHTLFWTDYYASETPDETEFKPPVPFTTSEFDDEGLMPERIYSQGELLEYLGHTREKVRQFIGSLDADRLHRRFDVPWRNYSYLELTLYSLRHVQHHAAQLNLLLRQRVNTATYWVSRASDPLHREVG